MKKNSNPQPQVSTKNAQEGKKLSSCAHSKDIRSCKVCSPTAKVINLPTEKKRIQVLQDQIKEKLESETNAKKAAIILSNWISKKR